MKRKDPSKTILASSNFCIYCGTHLHEWEKQIDHFIPFSMQNIGIDSNANKFVACRECNSIKSDMCFTSLQEARSYILPIKAEKGARKNAVHNLKEPKQCRNCGKEFTPKSKLQKSCTSVCTDEYYKKTNRYYTPA